MNQFPLHTPTSAPNAAQPVLEAARKKLGFVPNLYAHMATSPAALQAYKYLGTMLEQSALTVEEQQLVLLAASIENRCEYCVAAHSHSARNKFNVDDDIVNALRYGNIVPDKKLAALSALTRAVVRERGWVAGGRELNDFYAAGYTPQHALDVMLGVAMKTLSNYTSHLTDPPLDAAFADETWQAPDEYACCVEAA